MQKMIRFILLNFGPLIAYHGIKALYGFRPAVLVSLAWVLAEVAHALVKRRKLSPLFILSSGTAVAFGLLDLYLQNATFTKYESVVTNVITGCFFSGTLWAEESAIQSFARSRDPERVFTGKMVYRTRVLTMVWAGYFFVKAAVYFHISYHYSDLTAAAFRAGIGSISFYVLLALSLTQSRRVFDFLEQKRIVVTPARYLN